MAQLVDLKENIFAFYRKNAVYIRPAFKAALAFLLLLFFSRMFGYNSRINKIYIFAVISAMQAVMPVSFIFYISAILIAANLWMVSPEIMFVFLAVIAACWLAVVRIDRRYTLLAVLTPVLFFLKVEYLLPVIAGMVVGIGGVLPVAGGIMVYYISVYTREVSNLLATTSGNETGLGMQRMIQLLSIDRGLLVILVSFCLVVFISAVLYRMFHERAWVFTVIIGNVALALLLLSGRLIFELDYTIWRVFLECILAVGIAGIYQFFRGIGDVSRMEKVSFEDDEYIYYVKAVPKIKVSVTERSVTRIQPEIPSSSEDEDGGQETDQGIGEQDQDSAGET